MKSYQLSVLESKYKVLSYLRNKTGESMLLIINDKVARGRQCKTVITVIVSTGITRK